MQIFDCHIHVEKGLEGYGSKPAGGNVIFNSVSSYQQFASAYNQYFHSLIFDMNADLGLYENLIRQNAIRALKIHSRIQQISEEMYDSVIARLAELKYNIPIIYDAFYFGTDLEYQPSLPGLVKMLRAFPERKFVVAHAGGYNVLKYFFHLRDWENVGYDLSFSLQYLEDASCFADMIKLIRFTPKDRLFFGSDYPMAEPAKQLSILSRIMNDLNLTSAERQGILETNWIKFTEWQQPVSTSHHRL